MHEENFRALLLALHPDEHKAAEEYRRLHERSVRLFTLNRVADPHALADEALDRLARRVAEERIKVDSPAAFLQGIARHLLQEEHRRRTRDREAAEEWTSHRTAPNETDDELMESVEACLGRMSSDQQELLRNYYRDSGRDKIEHHRKLAADRGLSLNALRNQIMRARKKLDDCVRRRLSDVSSRKDTKR